jgi:flagellar motility protein MotE (MotC chaperone)
MRHTPTSGDREVRRAGLAVSALALLVLAAPLAVQAAEAPKDRPGVAAAPGEGGDNASLYCRNIANAAADARYARQTQSLAAMEKELDDRIAELEKKQAEYQQWVQRREDFLAKADESVVAIYSQMRPDAAAQQIAVMDEEAAAAILAKVSPRIASAILNEMEATAAAHLTNVMAGLPVETRKGANPS